MQSCVALSIIPSTQRIIISIQRQRLFLINDDSILKKYVISTSQRPPSCLENSFGTPTGLHKIADKIGSDEPKGTVFKARVPQGYTFSDASADEAKLNLITSRILRIKGLDPSLNSGKLKDSYNRYIYIHGTNHESKLGTPFSDGCIEIANIDIIELFDLVSANTMIWIE